MLEATLASGRELERAIDPETNPGDAVNYGITPSVEETLLWFIGCAPVIAGRVIGQVIGEAERRIKIPRSVTERSLRMAASPSEIMDDDSLRDFLDQVMSPQAPAQRHRKRH